VWRVGVIVALVALLAALGVMRITRRWRPASG
jgi:hypothetical protein